MKAQAQRIAPSSKQRKGCVFWKNRRFDSTQKSAKVFLWDISLRFLKKKLTQKNGQPD